jgi:replicative DNA helicase
MIDERMSGALQENLLTLLCFDDASCKLIRAAVTPQLFESSVYREVAGVAIAFIDQYGEAVKEHLPDHLEHILKGEDSRKAGSYKKLLDNLFLSRDSVNAEYAKSQLQKFVRLQTFKSGLVEAVEAAEDGNVEAAETAMQKALSKQLISFNPGLNLKDESQTRKLLSGDLNEEGFNLGVEELDRLGIIPRRKEVFMLIAPRRRGKSWFLIHCAKMALLQRWRPVVITLEMSEKRYAARMIQSMHSVSEWEGEVQLAQLVKNRDGGLEDVITEEVRRMSLSNPGDREKLTDKVVRDFSRRRPFYIKQFPTSSVTIKDIEAYLDQLERFEGFAPDVIILDYADLVKHDIKNKRLELGRIIEEFRGLAVSRNAAGITVSQGNRDAEQATTVTGDMVAEDISKLATVDNCLTQSKTEMEARLGLARILVDKARNQKDGFSLLITQAFAIGQWHLDSVPLKSKDDYWGILADKRGGDRARHKPEEDDGEDEQPRDRRRVTNQPRRRITRK